MNYKYRYPVLFYELKRGGGYIAFIPDFDYASTAGEDLFVTREYAKDIILGRIWDYKLVHKPLPLPSYPIERLFTKAEEIESGNGITHPEILDCKRKFYEMVEVDFSQMIRDFIEFSRKIKND